MTWVRVKDRKEVLRMQDKKGGTAEEDLVPDVDCIRDFFGPLLQKETKTRRIH